MVNIISDTVRSSAFGTNTCMVPLTSNSHIKKSQPQVNDETRSQWPVSCPTGHTVACRQDPFHTGKFVQTTERKKVRANHVDKVSYHSPSERKQKKQHRRKNKNNDNDNDSNRQIFINRQDCDLTNSLDELDNNNFELDRYYQLDELDSSNRDRQSEWCRSRVDQSTYRSSQSYSQGTFSIGQLFGDMLGAVSELLKSLVSLNCNSTLGEVWTVLLDGNRMMYLTLFIFLVMFARRLLVALFLL